MQERGCEVRRNGAGVIKKGREKETGARGRNELREEQEGGH